VAAETVYSREHETDADGDGIDAGEQESGADKLEVAVLLCLCGNFVVAALCYLTNKDTKTEADRSTGLDIFFFFAAVVFTVAPFALSFKYRKEEEALWRGPRTPRAAPRWPRLTSKDLQTFTLFRIYTLANLATTPKWSLGHSFSCSHVRYCSQRSCRPTGSGSVSASSTLVSL